MAADNTAIRTATQTLVASTGYLVHLTGRLGDSVELIHHGNVTDVVYYEVGDSEADLGTLAVAADEHGVVLPGERLQIGAPPADSDGMWVRLISAGTATVTVNGKY